MLLRRLERIMVCGQWGHPVSPNIRKQPLLFLLCHANPRAMSLQHLTLPDRYTPHNTLNCSITSLPQASGDERQLLTGVILRLAVGSGRWGGKWVEGCVWEGLGWKKWCPERAGMSDTTKLLTCFTLVHDFFIINCILLVLIYKAHLRTELWSDNGWLF